MRNPNAGRPPTSFPTHDAAVFRNNLPSRLRSSDKFTVASSWMDILWPQLEWRVWGSRRLSLHVILEISSARSWMTFRPTCFYHKSSREWQIVFGTATISCGTFFFLAQKFRRLKVFPSRVRHWIFWRKAPTAFRVWRLLLAHHAPSSISIFLNLSLDLNPSLLSTRFLKEYHIKDTITILQEHIENQIRGVVCRFEAGGREKGRGWKQLLNVWPKLFSAMHIVHSNLRLMFSKKDGLSNSSLPNSR